MDSPLSAANLIALANAWTDFGSQLAAYQPTAKNDLHYDQQSMDAWIQNAAQCGTNFSTEAMTAVFSDAAGAFTRMKAVLTQANVYIQKLQQKASSWDRFAAVANAMVHFATIASGGTAIAVLGAADAVEKAYIAS